MPTRKSFQAEVNIQLGQENRWRLLIRRQDFFADLQRLQVLLYKRGRISDTELTRVADKWGIPRIPWDAIMYCPPQNDPNCTPFLEWCGSRWGPGAFGVSYAPIAAHKVKERRFLFLVVDLEHTVENLIPLLKDEIIRVRKSLPRRKNSVKRKHPGRLAPYRKVHDLRRQGLSDSAIAQELWPNEWLQKGGRVSEYGEKGPLIQRVYDYAKAATKLINSIQPHAVPRKIKK